MKVNGRRIIGKVKESKLREKNVRALKARVRLEVNG